MNPEKEPFDNGCGDHDLLVAVRQRVADNTKRIDIHHTQIMGFFGALATVTGVILLIMYQFILPPMEARIKEMEADINALQARVGIVDTLQKEHSTLDKRMDRLFDLYETKIRGKPFHFEEKEKAP